MVLWILAVPMFPQIFMRFFTAKSSRALKNAATVYPLVTAFLFLCPILIGVWGHTTFSGLDKAASDHILPMMLTEFAPLWLVTLAVIGGLAAFMSTMDSQLLALSSIVTRDFYRGFWNEQVSSDRQVVVARIAVLILAGLGLLIAIKPPGTILSIAVAAFSGLAVLFPTTIAVLYWKRVQAKACITSIIVGELLVFAFQLKWIPAAWALGFLPIIPIIFICTAIIYFGTMYFPQKD